MLPVVTSSSRGCSPLPSTICGEGGRLQHRTTWVPGFSPFRPWVLSCPEPMGAPRWGQGSLSLCLNLHSLPHLILSLSWRHPCVRPLLPRRGLLRGLYPFLKSSPHLRPTPRNPSDTSMCLDRKSRGGPPSQEVPGLTAEMQTIW